MTGAYCTSRAFVNRRGRHAVRGLSSAKVPPVPRDPASVLVEFENGVIGLPPGAPHPLLRCRLRRQGSAESVDEHELGVPGQPTRASRSTARHALREDSRSSPTPSLAIARFLSAADMLATFGAFERW